MCNGRSSLHADNAEDQEEREFTKKHCEPALEIVLTLLTDFHSICPSYKRAGFLRDIETIERRTRCNGLVFLTQTLPSLFSDVLTYLETGDASYRNFSKTRQSYPKLFSGLLRHIYSTSCNDDTRVQILAGLYQVCYSFKKLKGPYTNAVLDEQLVELRRVDGQLYEGSDDPTIQTIIKKARTFVTKIFENFSIDDARLIPRPGPGATNTPTKKNVRYRPHVLYTQLEEFMPSNVWYQPTLVTPRNYEHMCVGVKATPWTEPLGDIPTISEPDSRFKFVFKEVGKARGICIEQLEMQWRQQAFRRYLYDHLENHPLTKGYLNFTDQYVNGNLALGASKRYLSDNDRLATGDMSEASNRISRTLVCEIYRDTDIYPYLDALSTRTITFPKIGPKKYEDLSCRMFAPMGSAICFPIMALTHYALIKAIISNFTHLHINDARAWVYGDDLIYHVDHAEYIYEWLPKFGMKMNVSKSYHRHFFRESCGVHAFLGVNITPTKFKSILVNPLTNKSVVSALKYEADLYSKGYLLTAKLIRQQLRSRFNGYFIPFVHDQSPVLGFKRPHSDARVKRDYKLLPRRWDADSQQWLYKAKTFCSRSEQSCTPMSSSELYLRKQVESPLLGEKLDEVPLGDLTLRWTWSPASAYAGQTVCKDILFVSKPYSPYIPLGKKS